MYQDNKVQVLPYVEIYGGETTPWVVTLINEDGSIRALESIEGYSCCLSIIPFAVVVGSGSNSVKYPPVLTKKGTITLSSTTGEITIMIPFASEDTINLRGKYIYQIEINNDVDSMIGQGSLLVKQNIGG